MKVFKRLILSFCLLLTVTIFTACGEAKVTSIYIQEDSINLIVDHNSTWSTEDIVVKAKLSNGKEKVITNVEFSNIDTSKTGEQVLKVTYGVYEYEVTITVMPTISNLELKGVPSQVKHKSQINLSDAYLKIKYSNGAESNVYTGFNITASSGTSTVGNFKYTVIYNNETKYFDYTVIKTVSSIEVTGATDTLKYNQTYDTSNITAIVTYSDDTTKDLTNSELTFTLPQNDLGDQKLIVKYTDSVSNTFATKDINVNVYEEIESISVSLNTSSNTAGYYVLGQELDLSQFIINVKNTKTSTTITTTNTELKITNLPDSNTPIGNHTITFTYKGKSDTKTISVVESFADVQTLSITSISIKESSLDTIKYGEELSTLTIIAKYNNNDNMTAELDYADYKDLSNDEKITYEFGAITFEGGNITTTTSLIVYYKGFEATLQNITINRVLKELSFVTPANSYYYGVNYVAEKVYATYTDSTEKFEVTIQNNATANTTKPENLNDAVSVEYTYNYAYLDQANANKINHAFTINDYITSIEILENSIDDYHILNQGTDFNISNLIIKETYASGNTVNYTYNASDNKYTLQYDLSKTGEADFLVTLNTLNAVTQETISTTNVILVIDRTYYVLGFDKPQFISINQNNQVANTYTDQLANTGNKGFIKLNEVYKVGDDNQFKFSPILGVKYIENNKTADISDFSIKVDTYIYDNSAEDYVLIPETTTGDEKVVTDYVSIDTEKHTFDFTDLAVDNKFKIVVSLDLVLIDGKDTDTIKPISFEFEVVDGWNAYTADDLSLIDNVNDEGKWNTLKTDNDLLDKTTNGIILHNNIEITTKDIPSIHFYSDTNTEGYEGSNLESVKGYMINADYYTAQAVVYERHIEDGGEFTIEGNYFTISIESLPLVKKVLTSEEDKAIVISTTLFSFLDTYTDFKEVTGDESLNREIGRVDENEENCFINNLSLMGNSNKNESTGQAGLVCYKAENINFTMDNCLSQAWYIAHFFEGTSESGNNCVNTLKNCTTFDSYNSLIYVHAARNVVIENSCLIGAGGPVMICDEKTEVWDFNSDNDYDDTVNGRVEKHVYTTSVTTTNSILESWVAGTEAWFNAFDGASTLASGLKSYLTGMNNSNLALGTIQGSKMNLIAVYKDGSVAGLSTSFINGKFTDTNHEYGLDFSNSDIKNTSENMIFQSFNGAMFYPARAQSQDLAEKAQSFRALDASVTDPQVAFATATDYLAVYIFNGMGAVIGM